MSNEDFVDKLYMTAGVSDPNTRDAMVNGLYNGSETRATVVRKIADSSAVADNHPLFRNPAYVLMQYFGYLRRNRTIHLTILIAQAIHYVGITSG
jgi:hypothetical protein